MLLVTSHMNRTSSSPDLLFKSRPARYECFGLFVLFVYFVLFVVWL